MKLLFLFLSLLLLQQHRIAAAFHTSPVANGKRPSPVLGAALSKEDNNMLGPSRRAAFLGVVSSLFLPSTAALAKISPEAAYANLRAAREELVVAGRKFFPKRDFDGLREYLENDAINMNSYEANAQTLLESKRLDAESKKEIGTIRRYGVGADVIIMYGGLKSEISEDNDAVSYSEVEKFYVRTLDSLEEVIAICRNNGL